MSVQRYSKVVVVCISLAYASRLLLKLYNSKKKAKNVRKEIHEVMMFSSGTTEVKKSKYSRCVITESMDRLLYYLSSPRQTLDICMYVFTNQDIANIIQKLHYKNVKIRMIVDADMAYASGSHVRKLEKLGIPVRWMKSPNIMHHKFTLVDASAENDALTPVVILGSLNWTTQALNGNWEDVIVTSQQELVRQYHAEFERLWILFKPIVGSTCL